MSVVSYWISLFDAATGGFRYSYHQPPSLTSTCQAVLSLELTNGLSALPAGTRTLLTAYLQRCIHDDGTAIDPLFGDDATVDRGYSRAAVIEEMTAYSQQAFDVLNLPPPPPRRFPDRRCESDGVHDYLSGLEWNRPAYAGRQVMFWLAQLCHDAERNGKAAYYGTVDTALDWLSSAQDARTGFWCDTADESLINSAIVGASYIMAFYYYRRRPAPGLDGLVDRILERQQPSGLFSPTGDSRQDYAAVSLLYAAVVGRGYRVDEAEAALAWFDAGNRQLRSSIDGGFIAGYDKSDGDEISGGGWASVNAPVTATTAYSTWSREAAAALAMDVLSAKNALRRTWRRLPFSGYHDPVHIQSSFGVTTSHPRQTGPVSNIAWRPSPTGAPLISVVVSAHNALHHLPVTLAALRCQTHQNWEAIIVDDGSADGTGALAGQWCECDGRIELVRQGSKGRAAAFNTGLRRANGQFAHCIDAGDGMDPGFYQVMIARIAAQEGDTEAYCLLSGAALVTGRRRIIKHQQMPGRSRLTTRFLTCDDASRPVRFLFDISILPRSGLFDEQLSHCYDWDLWLRFARIGVQFVPVAATTAWCRTVPASLDTKYIAHIDAGATVIDRVYGEDTRLEGYPVLPSSSFGEWTSDLVNLWDANVRRAINALDYKQVERLFQWARRCLPHAFWRHPEKYDFGLMFSWSFDRPMPRHRPVAALATRAANHLFYLRTLWPELDASRISDYATSAVAELTACLRINPAELPFVHGFVCQFPKLRRENPVPRVPSAKIWSISSESARDHLRTLFACCGTGARRDCFDAITRQYESRQVPVAVRPVCTDSSCATVRQPCSDTL